MKIPFSMSIAIYSGLVLFSSTHAHALDFDFGFEIDPFNDIPTLPGNCGIGGTNGSLCGIGNGIEAQDPDTTPFYQGQVLVDGVTYWHIIVGDPNSGFAMESYTQMELTKTGGFGSFSGGQPTDNGGVAFTTGGFGGNTSFQSLEVISGNGWDPLSNNVDFTGNGSGDPTRTVIRQVMGDGTWNAQTKTWSCGSGEFCSEFLKDRLNFKPIISQIINNTTAGTSMQARFQLDMRNITYSDDTTAGTIINTLVLTDPSDKDFFLVKGNFDMATDTQAGRSEVNGGRYIYNDCANKDPFEGSCWQTFSVSGGLSDYDEGTYAYNAGTNDPMATDWASLFDPAQNTFSGGGSGAGNRMKCISGGSGLPNTC